MITEQERSAPSADLAGLRERRKRRTRDALVRTALDLFTAQGYERTTVDEIAAAVEVSQRTFFRYFASKEEAAFAVQEVVESHFLAAVRARPAGEAPLQVLRGALLGTWDTLGEAISRIVPLETYLRMHRTIETTPALLAANLRRSAGLEEELAREIARREGLDARTDPRPRVLVAAFSGVMRAVGRVWAADGDGGVEAMRRITESHLNHVGPALARRWGGGTGRTG